MTKQKSIFGYKRNVETSKFEALKFDVSQKEKAEKTNLDHSISPAEDTSLNWKGKLWKAGKDAKDIYPFYISIPVLDAIQIIEENCLDRARVKDLLNKHIRENPFILERKRLNQIKRELGLE